MKINFNSARLQELDQIMAIERAGFSPAEAATKSAMRLRITTIPDTFIVAHDQEGIVLGYIVGPASDCRYLSDDLFQTVVPNSPSEPYQTVLSLAVRPDKRCLGIGSQLLSQLSRISCQQGRQAITLTCLDRLVSFYEKQGFINEGVSKSTHAGERWYNLVKILH